MTGGMGTNFVSAPCIKLDRGHRRRVRSTGRCRVTMVRRCWPARLSVFRSGFVYSSKALLPMLVHFVRMHVLNCLLLPAFCV